MNVSSTCPASTATGAAGQLFTMLLQSVLASPCNLSNPNMWPDDWGTRLDEDSSTYDFIVVGAGSAGCVVAHRLAQNTRWRVLLLEAGGDPPLTSEIPGLFFNIQKTEADWGYYTEPNNHSCLGFKGGRCYWPRGKMLGGSSGMDAMLYIRGVKRDFDVWEQLGNPGWGFEAVLKYFKASEDMRAPQILAEDNNRFHAEGGDLKVDNYYDDKNPLREELFQAYFEMGYNRLVDVNRESHIGFSRVQGTVDHGTRCSSAKAFLTQKFDNLHVVKYAKATKILINPISKQAEGVQFVRNGRMYTARNTKEIVVSCGTVNSPQLLMLSGIGPKEHLEELKIDVIANLRVGYNLQDHLFIPLWILLNKGAQQTSSQSTIDSIYDYFAHHSGEFSGVGITDITGFINTVNVSSPYPNTQLHLVLFPKNDTLVLPVVVNALGYVDDVASAIINSNKQGDTMMLMPSIINPKSFGKIKLRSSDYSDYPRIYPNYLEADEDMDVALKGTQFFEKFFQTTAMRKTGAEFININLPNCREYELFGVDYWKCFIRNTGTTEYHHTSSVKMGPRTDPTTVVDSRLRVHGIRNLRVADASIMPLITSGNTNAPTIMIGEKAAAMIKKHWGSR